MLTLNADQHPLMRGMHKPKPNKPAYQQGKRSVFPPAPHDWGDLWLSDSLEQAQILFKLPSLTAFDTEKLQ